jgi:hypothetical protein
MNREAAYELLNLPTTTDPATWWSTNGATYNNYWTTWIDDQGNNIYDIWCGYEWPYVPSGTFMSLTTVGSDVVLSIGHLSLGYEVLMDRWLMASGVSTHQGWIEDFSMTASLSGGMTNLTADCVMQYHLHAVKANGTASDAAWVWEATRIDYVVKAGHPSVFTWWDWVAYPQVQYASWNAGDGMYDGVLGEPVPYENSPGWLNLSAHSSLTVQLPTGSALGYEGVALTYSDYDAVYKSLDVSGFKGIEHTGTMSLGYNTLGQSTGTGTWDYDSGTKTLVVDGPLDFASTWYWANGAMYHGAPWIEFNVNWAKLASTDGTPSTVAGTDASAEASAGVSTSSEIVSLVSVMCAVMLLTATLVVTTGRRR